MNITSLAFLLATGLFTLAYWLLPSRFRVAWLLLGSLAFLASWSWQFILVLLVLAVANFFLAKTLGTHPSRGFLWTGIAFNVAALILIKYNGFYTPALATLLQHIGFSTAPGGLSFLVPVGISFLAVQFIATLVDVHLKRIPFDSDPLVFAVYVFYFPKLLSGPIERYKDFSVRIRQPDKPSPRHLALILVGLIRKIILADSLHALLPSDLFLSPSSYPAPLLLAFLLTFAFALYNDFAGYTSIVRGVSGLLGIQLTNNFRTPYFSRNFNEFWTRWHISLSNWLRDYIFFPVSRFLLRKFPNRAHAFHIIIPPILTMLVSGLWHSLSWNLFAWGGLHGLYLVGERLFTLRSRHAPDELPKWRQELSALIVFTLVVFAWIPFSMNLTTAGEFLSSLARSNWHLWEFRHAFTQLLAGATSNQWMPWLFPFIQMTTFLVPAVLLDIAQYKDELTFLEWHRWLQVVLVVLVMIAFFLLSFTETGTPFVYQGF